MLTICESIILSSIWVIYAKSLIQSSQRHCNKARHFYVGFYVLENNVCWFYNKFFKIIY